MVQVTWWTEPTPGSKWGDVLHQAYVPDSGLQVDEDGKPLSDPISGRPLGIHLVNATAPGWDQLQGYIVEAYNRELAPDPAVTLADFEWEQVGAPPA